VYSIDVFLETDSFLLLMNQLI